MQDPIVGGKSCVTSCSRKSGNRDRSLLSHQSRNSHHCRYLNDENYFGGNEVADLEALFEAMSSNYKTWVAGFAPLAVLGPADSPGVQEFSRTLFSLRPDIALSVSRTIYFSDYRAILPQVSA